MLILSRNENKSSIPLKTDAHLICAFVKLEAFHDLTLLNLENNAFDLLIRQLHIFRLPFKTKTREISLLDP